MTKAILELTKKLIADYGKEYLRKNITTVILNEPEFTGLTKTETKEVVKLATKKTQWELNAEKVEKTVNNAKTLMQEMESMGYEFSDDYKKSLDSALTRRWSKAQADLFAKSNTRSKVKKEANKENVKNIFSKNVKMEYGYAYDERTYKGKPIKDIVNAPETLTIEYGKGISFDRYKKAVKDNSFKSELIGGDVYEKMKVLVKEYPKISAPERQNATMIFQIMNRRTDGELIRKINEGVKVYNEKHPNKKQPYFRLAGLSNRNDDISQFINKRDFSKLFSRTFPMSSDTIFDVGDVIETIYRFALTPETLAAKHRAQDLAVRENVRIALSSRGFSADEENISGMIEIFKTPEWKEFRRDYKYKEECFRSMTSATLEERFRAKDFVPYLTTHHDLCVAVQEYIAAYIDPFKEKDSKKKKKDSKKETTTEKTKKENNNAFDVDDKYVVQGELPL